MDVKKILLRLLQEEQIADHKKKEKLDKQHRLLLKFVILDEADSMTKVAQFALRRIIEKYSQNVRFYVCNILQM